MVEKLDLGMICFRFVADMEDLGFLI